MMLGEDLDVASASSRVGYEDPSYFSREYKKMFGAPSPTRHRNVAGLKPEKRKEAHLPINQLLRAFRVSCAPYFNAGGNVFNFAQVICC
jgi:AraC-like DNA-binding protein